MRRISKTKQLAIAEAEEATYLFRLEFPDCMVPWCNRQASEVHHICRGASRKQVYRNRASWLHLCSGCHREFGHYASWPLERQYALKAIADHTWYDRVYLNNARGRAADSIDEINVITAILQIVLSAVRRKDPTLSLRIA